MVRADELRQWLARHHFTAAIPKARFQTQLCANPAVVGALSYDPGVRDQLHRTFYNDLDRDLADAAISLLTPDARPRSPAKPRPSG